MHQRVLPVVLWLGLTGIAAAKMCCVCCCVEPCSKPCPVARVEPPQATCDDVRPAPTCRSMRPSLCIPRLANAVAPDGRLRSSLNPLAESATVVAIND